MQNFRDLLNTSYSRLIIKKKTLGVEGEKFVIPESTEFLTLVFESMLELARCLIPQLSRCQNWQKASESVLKLKQELESVEF